MTPSQRGLWGNWRGIGDNLMGLWACWRGLWVSWRGLRASWRNLRGDGQTDRISPLGLGPLERTIFFWRTICNFPSCDYTCAQKVVICTGISFLKCFTSNTLLRKWYNSTINKKILVDSSITGCKLHLNKTIYSPFSLKIPISGLHAILIV